MTTTLTTEDLLALSIFKCKLCTLRLHDPIMQVVAIGNICGSCYNKSVHTIATQNNEMEALLAKLYVSCRYAGNGCTFDGAYPNMREHEQTCCCRRILCPFSGEQQCKESLYIRDIIEHSREKHADNVLTALNNTVCVNNPTKECPGSCYLLNINSEHLFLKTNLNTEKQCITYDFYHLNNDNWDSKNSNSSLNIKHANSVFNINRHVYIRPLFNIASVYGGNKSCEFKSPRLKMKSTRFLKTVEISGIKQGIKKTSVNRNCPKCSKYINSCASCSYLLSDNCPVTRIPCTNKGCFQLVNPTKLAYHRDFLCNFKIYKCPLDSGLPWSGNLQEFRLHIQTVHKNNFNRNVIIGSPGSSCNLYFTKGNDFFEQKLIFRALADITVSTVKLTTSAYDDAYTWEVCVKNQKNRNALIISGDCTRDGQEKTVTLPAVDRQPPFTVKTYIKRI